MNDNNVKKRKTLSYDEFLKSKLGVVKGSNDIADKAYDGEKKGDAGVATLENAKKIRVVKENATWKEVAGPNAGAVYNTQEELDAYKTKMVSEGYEMDLDRGDIEEEHAKAVLGTAFDMHKQGGSWDLQAAFNKVADDNGINTEDEIDLRETVKNSVVKILADLAKMADALKV